MNLFEISFESSVNFVLVGVLEYGNMILVKKLFLTSQEYSK
jgi:hypothetical protein